MVRSIRTGVAAAVGVGSVILQLTPAGALAHRPDPRVPNRPSTPVTASEEFDPALFSNPTQIDNPWTPLVPGTQLVFDGEVVTGGVSVPHRVVIIVTDLTKEIEGVTSVVVWDRDFENGQLVEEELAFEAQDAAGNVWNLGEYPEEYEQGTFAGAPRAWIAGQARARAGLLMRANPETGTVSYLQGYSPDIDFVDEAIVSATKQRTCVPVGCYDDVVVIDEWSPLDPASGHQLKYYARGVGNVQIAPVGGDGRETLSLVQIGALTQAELLQARQAAQRLDQRAYSVAPDVYRHTPRATTPGVPTTLWRSRA